MAWFRSSIERLLILSPYKAIFIFLNIENQTKPRLKPKQVILTELTPEM